MSETQALFSVLKQTADPDVVEAIRDMVENGEDRALNRINLLDFPRLTEELTLEGIHRRPVEKVVLSLQLPKEFVIVFEPVTHSAHFIDVQGEPTKERQQLSMVFNKVHAPTGTTVMRPGPLRLTLD